MRLRYSESAQTSVVSVQSDTVENVADNTDALGFDNEVEESSPGEKPKAQEPLPPWREEAGYEDDAWGFDNQEMPEQSLAVHLHLKILPRQGMVTMDGSLTMTTYFRRTLSLMR